jgi:hypothetical protein
MVIQQWRWQQNPATTNPAITAAAVPRPQQHPRTAHLKLLLLLVPAMLALLQAAVVTRALLSMAAGMLRQFGVGLAQLGGVQKQQMALRVLLQDQMS